MKNLQTLFEQSNYDSKNITNKSTTVISQDILNKIETEGVTLEMLQTLKVPVYKYKTQITIHGLFPTLNNNYLGGYKNLFQNKNLSIGVKWAAVDYKKKQQIYNTIRNYLPGWTTQHNSTDYFIYKRSERFNTKAEYINHLTEAQKNISHINKSLFYGNCGVFLSGDFFSYYLVTYINIGGILTENINPCIENITQATIQEITEAAAKKQAEREEKERQFKIECENRAKEEEKAKKPLLESARQLLTNEGYIFKEKLPIQDESIFIKIETDTVKNTFSFVAYKYTKGVRQKKFRYQKFYSDTLNFDFTQYSTKYETIHISATGWTKILEKKEDIKTDIVNNEIRIVQYTSKAIAIFGNTKPIKDKIKQIGGRFNPYLTNEGQRQPGWILPINKINEAKNLIK